MYLGRWSNVFLRRHVLALARPLPDGPSWSDQPRRPAARFAGQFWIGAAAWPAIYTTVPRDPNGRGTTTTARILARLSAAAARAELNELQGDGDKHWDLGWVYTVIAGVLNILVIYDAFAGPAFGVIIRESGPKEKTPS